MAPTGLSRAPLSVCKVIQGRHFEKKRKKKKKNTVGHIHDKMLYIPGEWMEPLQT